MFWPRAIWSVVIGGVIGLLMQQTFEGTLYGGCMGYLVMGVVSAILHHNDPTRRN